MSWPVEEASLFQEGVEQCDRDTSSSTPTVITNTSGSLCRKFCIRIQLHVFLLSIFPFGTFFGTSKVNSLDLQENQTLGEVMIILTNWIHFPITSERE